MSLNVYLFLISIYILSIESTSYSDGDELTLSGISIKDLDEDAVDSALSEESNNTNSDPERETEIRNAIEVFKKYDLWQKAYEMSGIENQWEFMKSQSQAIRDARKSSSKPEIIEFSDDITEQMKTDANNNVLNAFRNYDDLKAISSLLSGSFNRKYDKFWQCFIGLNSKQYEYTFWRNSYLTIKYDKIQIQLFRAPFGIPSEYETLTRIRREILPSIPPSIEVVESEMSDLTKNEVINKTIDAIKTFNTFLDVSTHLQQSFDQNHGKYWQSIVKHKSHPISSKFRFSPKLFIHITIGDLSVILYKSPTVTSHDVINSVKSSSSEAIVYISEMNNTMENEVKKIAIDGINYFNEFEEIGKYIKNVSESRFGNYWNCIVGVKPHYDANAVSKATNSYIVFGFANGDNEIVITLFESKSKNTIEAIVKARVATPKVVETSLNNEMNTQVVDICTQALTMFHTFDSITKFISESFDKMHSPHWHCVIGFKNYFEAENNHKSLNNLLYAELQFQDLKIFLFKSS